MQMLEITMFRFVTTQIRLSHPDLIHHMPNGTLRTIVVVIQFPPGVVSLAEMAGFTPMHGDLLERNFSTGSMPLLTPNLSFLT